MKCWWMGDRILYRVINILLDCRHIAIIFSVEYTVIANRKYLKQYFFQFGIIQEQKKK